MRNFKGPAPIAVYCTVQPTAANGLTTADTHRVKACNDESEIAAIIEEDRRAMCDTFGGLIDAPGASGRTYRAFRAVWTELPIKG
jgi:hypothetical protein